MNRFFRNIAITVGLGAALAFSISRCEVHAQTTCMNLGGGQPVCSNGTSSQRLGDFDFNSDGSWGMRLGGGMYLANPPANPDGPQYPQNDVQSDRPRRNESPLWRPRR